jgi:predicted metalloprotease with PDZ domain
MTVKSIRLLFLFLSWTTFITAELSVAVVDISGTLNGTIRFEARDSTFEEIVKKLFDNYNIEVKGMERRDAEKITFSYIADSPEDLLKALLRHIGIRNYAFEFTDATLKRLVAVPESTSDIPSFDKSPQVQSRQNELVSIAQIQSIVEASQAESAGLQEGDIILEYDGVPITSAQQLVSEVEKKAANSQIEMVVVRQKITTRLVLGGGFIGVRIVTLKIPRTELDSFQ